MKKFEGYLICSDIDGTLTNSKGKLSRKNLRAIKYFQRNGGKFTIATGRDVDFIARFAFKPNAPIIAANGTRIADNGEIIKEYTMPCSHMNPVIYALNLPYMKKIVAYSDEGEIVWQAGEEKKASLFETKSPKYKIVFVLNSEEQAVSFRKEMNEKFTGFIFERSWPVGVEMYAFGCGKGKCILYLKEMLSCHTVIGIGDFENDLTMMQCADISCATENALDEIKAEADCILPSNNNHAIAFLIKNLGSGKIKNKKF